ncbi:MAG TPA: helix-turn-helix transcriptional regulator [Ktedonobacterales bacterium]
MTSKLTPLNGPTGSHASAASGLDERALLLLGILRGQSQHGYQINELIERDLAHVTDMKKPTAYALLDRLEQSGAISVHTEREGARPPRKVYAITPAGEERFLTLLRANLAAADRDASPSDIGLMFLDALPRAEALALLRQRLAQLNEQIAVYARSPQHGLGLGIDLTIERHLALLRADRDWLASALERLAAS